ncbi:MAG: glycosyltransferase family 61 protein, partial [Ignavibacteria bacterium]|nr:glycosyltransferase family 61 protein [Ignavibacteria bacterium]
KKKTLRLIGFFLLLFIGVLTLWIVIHKKKKRALKQQQQKIRTLTVKRMFYEVRGDFTYTVVNEGFMLKFKPFPLQTHNIPTGYAFIPETFILSIPKGRAQEKSPSIITSEVNGTRYAVLDFFWPCEACEGPPGVSKSACEAIKGRVAALPGLGASNYYHWMVDILPKLKMLQDAHVEYDWLYVTVDPKLPFEKRTLELLGVDFNKVINSIEHPNIEADLLIAPSFPSAPLYSPRWVIDYLRSEMFSRVRPATINLSKKVFISRNKSNYRQISNEEDLFNRLKDIGFQRYYLEDLSVDDQIQLFAHADQIVAPHGAGLANLIFCKPGTAVVEIFQMLEDETFCYLSQILELRYTCVATMDFNSPRQVGGYKKSTELSSENIEAIMHAVNNTPSLNDSPFLVR